MSSSRKRIANAAAAQPAPTKSPSGGATLVQRMTALNKWRENYNPLQGLSLQRAIQLSRDYFIGYMADLQWTYFFIEQTDADLLALVERRTSRLLEMDYGVKIAKEAAGKDADAASKALAKAQSEFLQEKLEQIDNLYEAIEHLAMASFRGYAHCEKWFEGGELVHLEIVDQWNVVRDGLRGAWKYNPEARTASFQSFGDEALMSPENFLFREVRRPINRLALFKFVRDGLSNKDWDAFVEIYGLPGGVVTGPPNVPADKAPEYEQAARTVAEGGSGYLPNGSLWTANDGPRGSQPFKERLDFLTEKLILAGTGGKLTMLSHSGAGTLAGGAHADVFEQIAKSEARKIGEIINRQLVAPWLDAAFPGAEHLAYFELASNEETKVGEVVDHIAKLATAGYQVDVAEVSERSGYTVTLAPAPAARPPFGGAPGAPGLPGNPVDPLAPDPAALQNRRRLANRAELAATGRDVLFAANSGASYTAAIRAVVAPFAERLAKLAALTDADAQRAAAQAWAAETPALYRAAVARVPAAAAALQEILGTAAVSGFAEAADAKAKIPA
jgi:phage gp29-like protein